MFKDPCYEGTVLECLPNIQFKVQLDDGRLIRAYLSGKMNRNFIKVYVTDRILVTMPDTGDLARIVKRY